MRVEAELQVLPYATKENRSLLHRLINELRNGNWKSFRAGVAFAKQSGNYLELLESLDTFLAAGGSVELTIGANTFGPHAFGTQFEALQALLLRLHQYPAFRLYLYHEAARTYHPKLYMFSNEQENRALLIVGSSNWTRGGLIDNVEANVLLKLDLEDPEHLDCYKQVVDIFERFWKEAP